MFEARGKREKGKEERLNEIESEKKAGKSIGEGWDERLRRREGKVEIA